MTLVAVFYHDNQLRIRAFKSWDELGQAMEQLGINLIDRLEIAHRTVVGIREGIQDLLPKEQS